MASNFLLTRFFFLIFFITVIWSGAIAQPDCKLRKNEDGIKVYTCNSDTSKFKLIRVECTLNSSIEKLENVLVDFNNYTLWQFNTTESKSLKKISDSVFIYYAKIEAPWPVTDRDMVVLLRISHLKNQLIVSANSEHGIVPEKEDLLRVPSSQSKWIVTEKAKNILEVNYSIQIDPGGSVPAWLVNWVCANAPLQSFKKLKTLVEKK